MTGRWFPAVALAAVVAGAALPGAAATEHRGGGGAPPAPVHPVCDLQTFVEHPAHTLVCGTEASAQANATVPGWWPGPCTQQEPGPPPCDEATVGAEAEVHGDGYLFVCVDADEAAACGPYVAVPQPLP